MRIRKILPIGGLVGLVLLIGVVSPASACDPRQSDTADCPATPTDTASSTVMATAVATIKANSTVVPTAASTLIAVGGKLSGDSATSLARVPVIPEISFPLVCLLPEGDNSSNALGVAEQCPAMPVPVRAVKAAPVTTPAPKLVVAPAPIQPKGDAPSSAKTISDALLTIEPGAVHWYKIDNGNNFFLDIYLDTNGASGITLAMYSPEQANELSVDLQPKGRGGPVKNEPHDLLWKGSFATGVWYALVRNYNQSPVQYKIGLVQSSTERNCVSYPETLSTGQHVIWTDCGHYQDVQNFGK